MHRCPGHGPWTCVLRRTSAEACGTLSRRPPNPPTETLEGSEWGRLGNLGLEEGRVVQAGEVPLARWNPKFDVARRVVFKLILDCSPQ